MNASSILLAAALFLPTLRATAQTLVAVPDEQELTGVYAAPTAPAQPAAARLLYFGVVNSPDAQHEQYAQLRRVFETYQPTLVVVEKPDLGTAGTAAATIEQKGAAGYARLLAQQQQVPTERLDDPTAEYNYLRTKVDAEQLKLYYLLRASHGFKQRTGASKALTVKAMKQLIEQSAYFVPGTEHVIRNVAELSAAFHKYCPDGGQWWEAHSAYFCPQAAVGLYPAGSFAHTLGSAIEDYRAQYVYGKLAARAEAGERILVVMSCDQLPAAPAAAGEVAVK
ncbi:hypothetical protein [Hymenobacter bucti]|uniref:Uncharacterized protein n=1 Tax=Hymenobacter bucti TaxID=1844114 RepID=A0ABW4QRD5_9BACT